MLSLQKDSSIEEISMINRPYYIDAVERQLGKDTIIILTGQRRIGKSYILRLLRDKFASDCDNHVLYIDKEKYEFDSIKSYQELNTYINLHLEKGKKNYILIDPQIRNLPHKVLQP
ncbi:MAG: AAA family ATPase [Bacteroides sp.]